MNDAVTQAQCRPLPAPTDHTKPFWDAAQDRRLVHPHCLGCGTNFFPPHFCCPSCRSEDLEWAESTGRGTLYSFSIVSRAPSPGFDPPYVVGIVDLDEGYDLLTNIVGVEHDDLHIGMRVEVGWQAVGGHLLPAFTRDGGGLSA